MNKYIVFLTDGRQYEVEADRVEHYNDGIAFMIDEGEHFREKMVAWFPKSFAGYIASPTGVERSGEE